MGTNSSSKELIACFLEEGFKLDFEQTAAPAKKPLPASDRVSRLEENLYQQYLDNRYKMLFYFGFVDDAQNMSPPSPFCISWQPNSLQGYPKPQPGIYPRANDHRTD